MPRQLQGVIHGTMIELKEDPGLADGSVIDVILLPGQTVTHPGPKPSGERRTAAGMLAHLPDEVDEEIASIIRDRKNVKFRRLPR